MRGKWVHKSGLSFEGQFYKDRFQKGVFHFPDGDSFEGEWSVRYKKYFLKSGVYRHVNGSSVHCVQGQNLYIPSKAKASAKGKLEKRRRKKTKSLVDLEILEIENQTSQIYSQFSPLSSSLSNKSSFGVANRFQLNLNNNLNFPAKTNKSPANKEIDLPNIEEFSTENMNVSTFQINAINEKNYQLSHFLKSDQNYSSNVGVRNGKFDSVSSGTQLEDSHLGTAFAKNKKIKGKIFFYDCSNGTSCLYVGDFEEPSCVSTENALIIGIGGFYQEFVNNTRHKSHDSVSSRKLNLRKIFQFSYSPRLRGAFVSEEEFELGLRKSSRTLYHNGIMLQLFFARKFVPTELRRFSLPQETSSSEYKTKSSEADVDQQDSSDNFGLVSFPFEKQLLSIFGIVKGNEKQFFIKGKALFNNSLEISNAELSFRTSKNQIGFKISGYERTIDSIDSFFAQIQISKMKVMLQKPDMTKINGYHIYNGKNQSKFQGFFLNDFLIIHKDRIEECNGAHVHSCPPQESPESETSECYNCREKTADHLLGRNVSIEKLVELIKTKLCNKCENKLFLPKNLNLSHSSTSSNENKYAKKTIYFPSQGKEVDPDSNPNKLKSTDKLSKITFPYESPFNLTKRGYGLADYKLENHKMGPVKSPNFFKGEIQSGKKQGFIYENFENEQCYAGFYKNGFRQGFGQLYKYGKYFYEGKFRKGRKHGPGKIWFVNGEYLSCRFNNNSIEQETSNKKSTSSHSKPKTKTSRKPSITFLKNAKSNNSPKQERISRNQKKNPASTKSDCPKVEFSVLQANSRAMNNKKKRGFKPLNLFKNKLENENSSNLNEWITMAQQKIHSKRESTNPKWTKEQKEMFDNKSDLELSDIDKSQRNKTQASILKSGYSKSPKKRLRTVFLYKDKDSLNFNKNYEIKRKSSIFG